MRRPPTFENDVEFQKLLKRRDDVDLETAALEIARDAYPTLDFRSTLDWIIDQASRLAGPVARARNERAAMEEISRLLGETNGLHGDASHFQDADCSYLHRVVETGRGIPISLAVLYMSVANRVGIELKGAAVPVHFLARCETTEGLLFVDAYHSGKLMTRDETLLWLSHLAKVPRREIAGSMGEASPRTIILRMLNNLKSLYARQQNWNAAWNVQHRLAALQPSSYQEQRDLAIVSVRAGSPGAVLDSIRLLLRDCPETDRETLRDIEREAESKLAAWN